MQNEITRRDMLLGSDGQLKHKGYAKKPVLAYNPHNVHISSIPAINRLRLKEWDYYGVTTKDYFFSITVSHVGFIGLVFAYYIDFNARTCMFKSLPTPLGKGCHMPRSSEQGDVLFKQGGVMMHFVRENQRRVLKCTWKNFHKGKNLEADLVLQQPDDMDSIVMVTPMGGPRFYYNHKVNCMPAEGTIRIGDLTLIPTPDEALGTMDWGRGVWTYKTFWNWASASGFTPGGRRLGLNMGSGFGDLSAATENCFFIEGKMHKLGWVDIAYDDSDFMKPWKFKDDEGRLDLTLTPVYDRSNNLNAGIISMEGHQVFGRYDGTLITDSGKTVNVENVMGWAEEHKSKW